MINTWRDNPWLRRALFVGINLAAGAAIACAFAMPIHGFFAGRDARIEEQRALLARLQAIVAQEARIQSIARDTDAQVAHGEFLAGPSDSVISADLQTRLKSFAAATGARLRSVQALPPKIRERVRYFGSRLEIYGSLQSIHQTIHSVESGKPYLFVTGAVIRLTNLEGIPLQPIIEAQLEIFGAVQPDGGDR